jgi:hypothetical protein
MKACDYCGRESPDELLHCHECGALLPLHPRPAPSAADACGLLPFHYTPEIFTPEVFENFLEFIDGYHRIDWPKLSAFAQKEVPPDKQFLSFHEAGYAWANKLREDLGGAYSVTVSPECILLSEESPETRAWLLAYISRSISAIAQRLGPVAWSRGSALKLFLTFSEEDDYYDYIAHYFPQGNQSRSSGICIRAGYAHIAFTMHTQFEAAHVISHELVHDAVTHLSLPHWLDEGLAQIIERSLQFHSIGQLIDRDLADHHHAFWNEENIQLFWSGVSFRIPESCDLSYSLAEILLTLIVERTDQATFQAFIQSASHIDAGQTAALDLLQIDLGELAATFLGNGSWRPRRKLMVDAWQRPHPPSLQTESATPESPAA